jgi:beta-glucosidase/6-phospho-beta-glucosidase/beta-galactosidase
MFHWDLPQFIQDLGGFSNRLLVDYFRHYADVLYSHFGDRVKRWITFNEPFNFCIEGYGIGTMAPGVKQSGVADYLCSHHTLLSHAAAYQLYQEKYVKVQKGQVGISLNARFLYPKDKSVDESLINRVMEYRVIYFYSPPPNNHTLIQFHFSSVGL